MDTNNVIFDYKGGVSRAKTDRERRWITLLQKYMKISFSWDTLHGWLVDEEGDLDTPEAYESVYLPDLFRLLGVEKGLVEQFSPHLTALVSSTEGFFVLYVLEVNQITAKVSEMTLSQAMQDKIFQEIKHSVKR